MSASPGARPSRVALARYRTPYLVLCLSLLLTLATAASVATLSGFDVESGRVYIPIVFVIGLPMSGALFGVTRAELRARLRAEHDAAKADALRPIYVYLDNQRRNPVLNNYHYFTYRYQGAAIQARDDFVLTSRKPLAAK